jgi:hypothetical protein
MKKLLSILAILLSSILLHAQQDIPIKGNGPIFIMGRGLTWSGSGVGSINNNWIIQSPSLQTGVCLFLHNNDSSSHQVNFGSLTTPDPAVSTYQGNTTNWVASSNVGFGSMITPANLTSSTFIPFGAAASVVIPISAGSGSGTVDFFALQSSQSCTYAVPPVNCNQTISVTLAASNGGGVLLGTVNSRNIVVCDLSITFTAAPTAAFNPGITIGYSAVSNCSSGITNVWQIPVTANEVTPMVFGSNIHGLIFPPNAGAGLTLCATTGAFGAVSAQVNLTYALF